MMYYMLKHTNLKTALNTIGEGEKEIAHAKYITIAEFIRFSGKIFNVKLTLAKLATNTDLDNVEQCTS